ncbi:MAG TPA: DUF4340 domain-containing protein [Verrucomicrobiae bacterium]|nr:DUF4340 domain-containing protein [Verrucomicrobiae bacterium]
MKSRTTLVLVLVALVIGGLVALDYYWGTSTQELQARNKRVLDFQSKDIIGLDIGLTNQVYALERSGDQWQIKKPLDVRANYGTVSSILDELEFAERKRSITEQELKGLTRKDFGLQLPRVHLTLRNKKGSMVLLVGNETPTKDAVYAQLQGKKDVLVLPKSIYERLDRTLDDLRDRTVIDFQPASATRIEIKSPDRVIELAKSAATTNAEPRWAVTRPLAARADPRKVSELLSDLSGLRVTDFVSEDAKDIHTYQLDEPEREVTVWTGESGKTLQIGRASTNDPGKVYAKLKSTDSIYTVPSASVQKFAVQANDLRDAQVLEFPESDVHGIEVLHGTDKISLVRTDSTWSITAPAVAAAEGNAVQQLLRQLGSLKARQFMADVATDLDKYGLAAPLATVTLRGEGTNLLAQLLVGALDASNAVRFVKRVDEPFVYGVDTNIVGWLPANYLALRARTLVDLKSDQVTKLTIERKSGKVTLQRDADKKWKLMEPAQGVIDNDALQRLLDELASVYAEEFVREGRDNLAEYGLDQPEATVAATLGDKTYTLTLGKLLDVERRYAFWSDPPLVFTIWTSRANTLSRDIVTQPNPQPAPATTNALPSSAVPPVSQIIKVPAYAPASTNGLDKQSAGS